MTPNIHIPLSNLSLDEFHDSRIRRAILGCGMVRVQLWATLIDIIAKTTVCI